LFVFLFWFVVAAIALGAGSLFGQGFPTAGQFAWPVLLPVFITMLLSNVWEEIGWRGFALPKLQKIYHPLFASLILGAIWAIWHLPLFFAEGSPQAQMGMIYFFLATLGYSILYSWIYNGSKESLFMIWLLHSANNATVTYTMLFFKPLINEPVFSLAILGLFDALVILLTKFNLLYQREAYVGKSI